MIKDNVSVTFTRNNGKKVTIEGDIVDGKLYRAGAVVRCDCDYSNPVEYVYCPVSDTFKCPSCGNNSEKIHYNNDSDVELYYIGIDYNTMQDLYKLSDTLPYNKWLRISEYFVKLNQNEVELDYPLNYIGWVTSVPETVEEILNIPLDRRVGNRDVYGELEERVLSESASVESVSESEYFDYVDKLHEVFSVVETPYGVYALIGETYNNPLFPPNKYGRGEYWVIEKDTQDIWYIRLNHQEGDDLQFNNICINGGLKGIGKRIDYDENVHDLLLKLG